jgi:hypothetical protein
VEELQWTNLYFEPPPGDATGVASPRGGLCPEAQALRRAGILVEMSRAAILVLVLGAAFAPAAVARDAAKPSLGLLTKQPLTIRGLHFKTEERVRVRVAAHGSAFSRTTIATVTGSFTVRFRLSLRRCDRFSVQAFGSEGSRARLLPTMPSPDCSEGSSPR